VVWLFQGPRDEAYAILAPMGCPGFRRAEKHEPSGPLPPEPGIYLGTGKWRGDGGTERWPIPIIYHSGCMATQRLSITPSRLDWDRPCTITPLARVEPQHHNSLAEGTCLLRGRDEVMGRGAETINTGRLQFNIEAIVEVEEM